jgi:type IV pilus assembly protein PilM
MLKQRKSIVGLDIGTSSIKAIELTHDRYDYVITGYSQIDVPSEQARQDALQELFRSGRFRTRRVASAVSGKNVVFRYINMIDMPEDKLSGAIRFEAVVEDQARLLTELGLQPISIAVDSFAIGNAFELCDMVSPGLQEDQRTVALIDIGATKSSINILRNNVTCFAREVPMGGQDLTNAIMRRFGLESAAAETLKREAGDQGAELKEAVSQVLDDLGNEINLSFDFFENQFDGEVQDVFLSGGTVLLPFLEESLEKIFEKRTRVWNPVEGLKVKSDNVDVEALNQRAPQLAVAMGLAAAS